MLNFNLNIGSKFFLESTVCFFTLKVGIIFNLIFFSYFIVLKSFMFLHQGVLSAFILFFFGFLGILLNKYNFLVFLFCIEIIFLGISLSFIC